jgi:hypothetical protein
MQSANDKQMSNAMLDAMTDIFSSGTAVCHPDNPGRMTALFCGGRFFADVESAVDFGDDFAGLVEDVDGEDGLGAGRAEFTVGVGRGRNVEGVADGLDLLAGEAELGANGSAAGLLVADGGGLVPHDVGGAEIFDEHEHVHGVGHGVEGASEMDADVIAVPPMGAELDIGGEEIGIEAGDANAGSAEWAPEVDEVAGVALERLEDAVHGEI